ncbi:MAG: ribosome-associated translation inhibitor RaiA [Deltaproteobacteria bacterium]|nr:ribosome-associated translation inhibitor RaiA [Deltaproteobacteria bacterium]MBW2595661.1 ribosome-associated translation inhibitor RaiA [Deltaproteobacteria bacterium]
MQTSFTFRNMEAEEWLKDYVDKKLSRIDRYMDKPVNATVTLSIEKFRNVAEIKLSARGINLQGREEAKEMTLAVDNVIDKVERQIKKYKQKTRNHKDVASRSESMDTGAEEYDEYDESSKVVETKKIILEPMSLEDAVLEMDESRKMFVIYRDSSSEKVSVIYRRDDEKYVLIETNS